MSRAVQRESGTRSGGKERREPGESSNGKPVEQGAAERRILRCRYLAVKNLISGMDTTISFNLIGCERIFPPIWFSSPFYGLQTNERIFQRWTWRSLGPSSPKWRASIISVISFKNFKSQPLVVVFFIYNCWKILCKVRKLCLKRFKLDIFVRDNHRNLVFLRS